MFIDYTENYENNTSFKPTSDAYSSSTESQLQAQIQIQYPPPNTLWWIS